MELLDRYLQAVKKHLPWKRQDDIVAELRANLESQLEEKEAELGRPLTRGEAEDWLRQMGHPIQVAARYQPQQYVIGPGMFPIYWYVLRLAAGWGMAIYAVTSAVEILSGNNPGSEIAGSIARAPGVLMSIAAWVTLIFAAIEFATTRGLVQIPPIDKLKTDWNPSELPRVEETAGGGKPRSYAKAVAEVVFGFILLIWLLLIPHHPYLLMGPGAVVLEISPYELAPVWWMFFWCIVALNVVQLGWRCVDLLREQWQGPRLAQHVVVKSIGLLATGLMLRVRDHGYILLKNSAAQQREAPSLAAINHGVFIGLLVIFAISLVQFVWETWQLGLALQREREGRR
jgi:hypothetical protein